MKTESLTSYWVRISWPSWVIRTVCSCCAARLPSFVTTVHPSLHCFHLGFPSTKMGSIVKVWPTTILSLSPFLTGDTVGRAWKFLPTPCPIKSAQMFTLCLSAKSCIACNQVMHLKSFNPRHHIETKLHDSSKNAENGKGAEDTLEIVRAF